MNRFSIKGLETNGIGPLDLELQSGDCVCLSGPSGSGKSLTLRAIADLDPSDWIWPHATTALAGAFPPGFRSPPGDDDALERLILDAAAAPIALAPRPAPEPTRPSAERTRKRDRMKRALRSWFSR